MSVFADVSASEVRLSATSAASPWVKAWLLGRVWLAAIRVQLALRRQRLPDAVVALGRPSRRRRTPPALLSRAVSRGLRFGPWQPRCLIRSLVLYQLLREQGDTPDLVIGLPERADTHEAHAWVELGGRDIGPMPGRGNHRELSRFPRAS
jgi:hypothetical protein